LKLVITPAERALRGELRPPGDKSISHRAAILGGLAAGETRIRGFLDAADTEATLNAMAQLGVDVDRDPGEIRLRGGRLRAPGSPLDLGNSGTGMRLLAGALSGHPDLHGARLELVGDESLSRRPMNRIVEPLRAMGARIDGTRGHAPLHLWPRRLDGVRYHAPVASAQVKSAVLLAGLSAAGETVFEEPSASRDHTERMLPAFGAQLERSGLRVSMQGPARLLGIEIDVPGDLSSAAFLIAAGTLVPGSALRIGPVGVNPTRDGLLRILERMGAPVRVEPLSGRGTGAEPVAMLTVGSAGRPAGCDVPAAWVPLAIDEFPVVMALAAAADGDTTITGAAELRVKESDRIEVMVRQLRRLGVEAAERDDGAHIRGGRIRGGAVDAEGDHRIAMSLAVLGLVAEGPVEIHGAEWIRTSYPAFPEQLRAIGAEASWA
jgi:3-phosphoshikimate 1-carboxyvinyltransferase